MAVCHHCGNTTGEEKFCGVCGVRQGTETTAAPKSEEVVPQTPEPAAETPQTPREERPTSMAAQRGTGELTPDHESSDTSHTGPRRGKPKALESGKVLNNRYEVV